MVVVAQQSGHCTPLMQERLLAPKCVAMGESRPVLDIGGSAIPETVSVVGDGTNTVGEDVMSKRQCIQRSDFSPVCGLEKLVPLSGTGVVGHQKFSIRELHCGSGSSVSMPELSGYSCVVDSGVSLMRSNAESASNVVTSSCLGDRILDTSCTDTVSTSLEADPGIGVAVSVGK
nr:hypothetical protein [Tanacetum cinerariifolium]